MRSLFIALRGRFPEDRYKHFCSPVRILDLCLQFKISEEEINEIELEILTIQIDMTMLYNMVGFPHREPARVLSAQRFDENHK